MFEILEHLPYSNGCSETSVKNDKKIIGSFWTFSIPEQNINIPFLLVGKEREPDITMDRSHMNFKALLIGKAMLKKYLVYHFLLVVFEIGRYSSCSKILTLIACQKGPKKQCRHRSDCF